MQTQQTNSWLEGLSKTEGEEYLVNLHRLAGQLDDAMKAIVQRKLSSLQDSLLHQQISCLRLQDLPFRSGERATKSSRAETDCVDPDLALEIRVAMKSVLVLNDRYAALLKHSGDTLRLLAGFYRSYRGSNQLASSTQPNFPSWSCEV